MCKAEYAVKGRGQTVPDTYVRRTRRGRYLEVRTRTMPMAAWYARSPT